MKVSQKLLLSLLLVSLPFFASCAITETQKELIRAAAIDSGASPEELAKIEEALNDVGTDIEDPLIALGGGLALLLSFLGYKGTAKVLRKIIASEPGSLVGKDPKAS